MFIRASGEGDNKRIWRNVNFGPSEALGDYWHGLGSKPSSGSTKPEHLRDSCAKIQR